MTLVDVRIFFIFSARGRRRGSSRRQEGGGLFFLRSQKGGGCLPGEGGVGGRGPGGCLRGIWVYR